VITREYLAYQLSKGVNSKEFMAEVKVFVQQTGESLSEVVEMMCSDASLLLAQEMDDEATSKLSTMPQPSGGGRN